MDKQMTISAFSDELAQVRTKKKEFLSQIERIVPWKEWLAMIQPCYYKGERGNKPYPLKIMLRLYLLQNLYDLSDEATVAEAIDSRAFSEFCSVDSSNQVPDGDTLGRFRNLLIRNGLQEKLFAQVVAALMERGLILKKGTIVDSTIISAPSSTKNKEKKRDPDDKRVIELIKRYLKAGVTENGLLVKTEEGSPQGGPLSPLLANIYLNEYDQEMGGRGVPVIRYADDIVVLAKSERAAKRLLESGRKYLEGKLKLKVNQKKSRVVSVFAIRNFKFLGFTLGKNGKGIYVRVHGKSWKKMKSKLKELSSRRSCQSIRPCLEKIKIYMRGWLNYYGIADMKNRIDNVNSWLYHRIRMCIWKQWKKTKTKVRNLTRMGVPKDLAWQAGNSRRGYWFTTHTV